MHWKCKNQFLCCILCFICYFNLMHLAAVRLLLNEFVAIGYGAQHSTHIASRLTYQLPQLFD